MKHLPVLLTLAFGLIPALSPAAVLDVTGNLNNLKINSVLYEETSGFYNQIAETSGPTNIGSAPVYIRSVTITDGVQVTLPFFNTEGALVLNLNPALASITGGPQTLGRTGPLGIGVDKNGIRTYSTNPSAFATALAGTTTDTDIRNYSFYDLLTPAAPPGGFDYDLLFHRALLEADYMLVSERWGNSTFSVTALDIIGNPIGNTLVLGGSQADNNLSYNDYDWTTGYAPQENTNHAQAQALTVFSVKKFFEGQNVQTKQVFGIRVNNDNEADVKILGIGVDTFTNNPENPLVIPEPSAFLMALISSLGFMVRRRRSA